jgi:hypothetical protein
MSTIEQLQPTEMWDRFIAHLNSTQPLTGYGNGKHQSFMGSIEQYRKVFLEANEAANRGETP